MNTLRHDLQQALDEGQFTVWHASAPQKMRSLYLSLNLSLNLSRLQLRGVVLALDNFGSGQASMQQLESIPFGMLKIAPAFVGKIGHGIKPEQLLSGMICLGQALELKVVAKGVEQAAQVEFCRESGCQILQGHYFAPALTVGEFQREWLHYADREEPYLGNADLQNRSAGGHHAGYLPDRRASTPDPVAARAAD